MSVNVLTDNIIDDLKNIIPDGIITGIKLSSLSRWKIGGLADCIIKPSNSEDVRSLIRYLKSSDLPYIVIGSTSNLLFSDKGLRVVAIQIDDRMSDYHIVGNTVWVQAGKWVCMNGGSQRKGIGSNVKSVTAISPEGNIKKYTQKESQFQYRSSIFQENNNIITEVELLFSERKPYRIIRNEMLKILRARRGKFPQKVPNCGSTFISNPEIYKTYGSPGKIIEELGFKGYKIGGAEVSKEHANFINNIGNATANDVVELIKELQIKVKNYTGFDMKAEVKFVDEKGGIKPANLI